MRLAVALALCLAACGVDPVLTLPDAATADTGPAQVCTPGAQVACTCVGGATGAQVCSSDGRSLGACDCPDAGGGVDAGAVDTGPRDTGAVDTGQPDAGADVVEADVYGACIANGLRTCDGRSVMVQVGERDDAGVVHHCGACGATCDPGAEALHRRAVCNLCRCISECAAGFGDCDGDATNGCESSLSSVVNCGACGRSCAGSCSGGTCSTP